MKMPMMCLPAGASDGSYIVGTVNSSSGDCEGCPYFASSQARSTYSSDGQMCIVARCCGPSAPGQRAEIRQAVQRQIDLARRAFAAVFADRIHKILRQRALIDQMQKRELRREIADHLLRVDLFPALEHHAARAAIDNLDVLHRRIGADLHASAARRRRNRFRNRAHAAAHEAPQSAVSTHASHHVMQQDVRGAGRARSLQQLQGLFKVQHNAGTWQVIGNHWKWDEGSIDDWKLDYAHQKGTLQIHNAQGQLRNPQWFTTTHNFSNLSSVITWENTPVSTKVEINPLTLMLEKSNVTGEMTMDFQQKALPVVDIKLYANTLPLEKVLQLLPRVKMGKQLLTWLDKSLQGNIKETRILVQGDLSKFPFDNNEGNFEISTHYQGRLDYAPDWPLLSQLNANVLFKNRALFIKDATGLFKEGILQKADAEILDLGAKHPLLSLQSELKSTLENAIKVLQKNPEQTKLVKTLSPLTFQGPMRLDLGLQIPLSSNGPLPLKVRGTLHCQNDKVTYNEWNLPINNLRGDVLFTEKKIFSEMLQGTLLGAPTQFQITMQSTGEKPSPLVVDAKGHVVLSTLQSWLKMRPRKIYWEKQIMQQN